MKNNYDIELGERIRLHRERLGLNREEFSERAGISPQFLAVIETGKKGMSTYTAHKICKNTNISSEYLLMGIETIDNIPINLHKLLEAIPDEYNPMIQNIL